MLWVVAVAILAAVSFWVYLATLGVPRTDSELREALDSMRSRERSKGFLLVQKPFTSHFVQIAQYTSAGGPGLEIAFPEAKWSSPFVPAVVRLAASRGITHFSKMDEAGIMRFVILQFGSDLDQLEAFIQCLLRDVLGHNAMTRYRVRVDG